MREKENFMSKAVPHFTPEWLEEYNKRLGKVAQKPPKPPQEAKVTAAPTLTPYSATESVAVPFRAAEGKQSKTEQKYNREVLGGIGRFEAVTLHLPGGGRYTPRFHDG